MHIVAANQHPTHSPWPYLASCAALFIIFFTLMILVTRVPAVSSLDAQLSQSLQTLRNPIMDRLMLGTTLLADLIVTNFIVAGIVVLLLSTRQWWLSLHLVCVYAAAKSAVVVFKILIARARPELSQGALEFFSFPSGHACAAAVVSCAASSLIAYGQPRRLQYLIYAAGLFVAVLVALSRVYLLAHWPSDVLAGATLGYALGIAFIWQLHTSTLHRVKHHAPLILMVCALTFTIYLYLSFTEKASDYGIHFAQLSA